MRQYRMQDLIDKTDKIAEDILKEKPACYRDNFFPKLIDKLNLKTGAEIGVDKGEFSDHILSKSKLEKLYCIDCWMDDFGSGTGKSVFEQDGNLRMQKTIESLSKFGNRVKIIKNISVEAAKQIPDNSIDFCYIDGDHSLEGIYTDIYTWINKVKTGGIISGHDYKDDPNCGMKDYFGKQLPYRVKTVVDNFCNQYGFKVHSVGRRILSFWFVKNI